MNTRLWGDLVIVECSGSLVFGEETASLLELIRKLLPESRRIVLDLAGVSRMDSGGLGTLVGLHASARNAGGSIILLRPSARVHALLDLTKVSSIFDILETPEEAAAFSGAQKGASPTG